MMSMLDGFSGYNQVVIRKEDRHKTTFTSPWGTFEYLRMPFDLLNAGWGHFSKGHGLCIQGVDWKIHRDLPS